MATIKADEVIESIDRGKIHAMFDMPMIEGDVSKMIVVLTTEVETAATDGKTMWANPYFINALNELEIEFIVKHEWSHCFLKHFSRSIKFENKNLVQLATDEEANHLLRKAGVNLLKGALCTPGFEDMTFEQIYRVLEKNLTPRGEEDKDVITEPGDGPGPNPPPKGSGKKENDTDGEESGTPDKDSDDGDEGSGDKIKVLTPGTEIDEKEGYELPPVEKWGEVKDPGPMTQEQEAQAEFEDTIRQETTITNAALNGKLPEAIEKHVRSIAAKSKIDWKRELADFVEQSMHGFDGYLSWSKPNKRFAGLGIHMPSIIPESEQIAILLDSSGSMDDEMFDYGLTETKSVIDLAQPDETHVIVFDHNIVSVDSYEHGVEFPDNVSRIASGGTNVQMALEYVKENLDVNGIIVISDMEFYGTPEDPDIPTLWVEVPSRDYGFWGGFNYPFGRAIKVDKHA